MGPSLQVVQEVRQDADLRKALSPTFNILKYLHAVEDNRLQDIRLASSLAAFSYHMKSVTVRLCTLGFLPL